MIHFDVFFFFFYILTRMREGVSEEDPWGKYDPSGIEIMMENQKKLDDVTTNMLSDSKSEL